MRAQRQLYLVQSQRRDGRLHQRAFRTETAAPVLDLSLRRRSRWPDRWRRRELGGVELYEHVILNAVTGAAERLQVRPYALANLMGRYQLPNGLSLQVNAKNLFDKKIIRRFLQPAYLWRTEQRDFHSPPPLLNICGLKSLCRTGALLRHSLPSQVDPLLPLTGDFPTARSGHSAFNNPIRSVRWRSLTS